MFNVIFNFHIGTPPHHDRIARGALQELTGRAGPDQDPGARARENEGRAERDVRDLGVSVRLEAGERRVLLGPRGVEVRGTHVNFLLVGARYGAVARPRDEEGLGDLTMLTNPQTHGFVRGPKPIGANLKCGSLHPSPNHELYLGASFRSPGLGRFSILIFKIWEEPGYFETRCQQARISADCDRKSNFWKWSTIPQTLESSFSAVSTPIFASKYALESA